MSSETDLPDISHIKSPVCQANRIKQSIDLAPPPRISTQSICVYQAIWLPIFCCPQAGVPFFSPILFSTFLLPHLFGDPSAYLPYHVAKPSIYAPICLSNYILASICLTIWLFTHSPVNHVVCLGGCQYWCPIGCCCLWPPSALRASGQCEEIPFGYSLWNCSKSNQSNFRCVVISV